MLKKTCIYVFLLLSITHLLYWRQYSLEALFLGARFVVIKKKENLYRLVGICNKLNYFLCSSLLLNRLLKQFPGDSLALFNLAYIEYKKNNFLLSKDYLQNYLSLKEDNTEAYLLYAKVLHQLNKKQEAIDILYWALSKKKEAAVIKALVSLLHQNNKSTEALSLLFGIQNSLLSTAIKFNTKKLSFVNSSALNLDNLFLNKNNSLKDLMQFSFSQFANNLFKHKSSPSDLSVFSIIESNFFIPMRLKKSAQPRALRLIVDTNFNTTKNPLTGSVAKFFGAKRTKKNTIALSFLEENYVFLNTELITGEEIVVPKLFVGPWILKNIKFIICKNCQSQLYLKNTSSLSYRIRKKYIFYFVNLKHKLIEKPVSR